MSEVLSLIEVMSDVLSLIEVMSDVLSLIEVMSDVLSLIETSLVAMCTMRYFGCLRKYGFQCYTCRQC